jgi:predicted alpha-1,2-mannosidase
MEEFVNSLLTYYRDGGLIPRGPSGGNYTYVMTGASSTPFVVSAFQKGIRGFDPDFAYQALRKNHMPGGIMEKAGYEHYTSQGGGLPYYLKNGYVPYPLPEGKLGNHQDGAGLTLEYAYQDWTLAQMAKALGQIDDYTYFLERSQNYHQVFDQQTGWMRAKNKEGKWHEPFDPYQYQHGFVESNSAQATWFVPHDIPGLAKLMGGKKKAVEKLEQQFNQAESLGFTSGNSHERELHPEYSRIPINYGNQPSMQAAYIFNLLDRPDLTQFWSRQVVAKAFSGLSPSTGYNGDEDQGFMGSLAVLMKIGLFQMNGGTEANPSYQLGSPIFDQVTIHLNRDYYSGRQFVIRAHYNGLRNFYIQKRTFNGVSLKKNSMRHLEITGGGVLTLELSDKVDN